MLFKSSKLFPIVIVLTLFGLLIIGCGKQGNRFNNGAPSIAITSYEGYDPLNPYTDPNEVTLFQQRIFWQANDPDGVIAGYAYRVIDSNNQPISTAGNLFIDSLGIDTPQSVLDKYGKGWVLHYKPGSDQTYPLSDPRSRKTIWTTSKYALVNFITSNALGLPDTTISRFEVICVDNRGLICEDKAVRTFRSYSGRPTCMLSTTKGDPDGKEVGTGIRLSFTLDDVDPFIQPTAWYYRFKIQKVNYADSVLISENPSNGWISTLNQPKINQFLLTKYTNPPINNDFNSAGVQQTFTRVVAEVVDLAGIISVPDTIKFAVKEGFHPKTLIHMKRVYALGSNHYIDYTDEATPEVWPYTIENDTQLFATPFFRDIDGYYTAVKSSNLKSWIRWGWHGEYGRPEPNITTITDDPYDKKVDVLLDEDTNKNYYSEITHFDIRLNGKPYNYPPFADSIFTDPGTGKRWLRVPVNSSLGQTIVLTNLPANTPDHPFHFFEVRAVDLQNEADPTPAEFKFKIVEPVSKAQQSGILVIDDDIHNVNFAPEDSIDARYANMLSGFSGTKVYRKRHNMIYSDTKNRQFALSDIQNFKLIIYHDDYTTTTPKFNIDQDAFALYLKNGGNMVISGGANMAGLVQSVVLARQRTFEQYFGLNYDTSSAISITNQIITNTWFVKAKSALTPYSDINLAFDINSTNPNPEPIYDGSQLIIDDPNEKNFVSLLNTRMGLGPITYFDSFVTDPSVKSIFTYVSKPVYSSYYCPPTLADFNRVNGKAIGIRKVTNNNACYILGFPLSYMTKSSAKQFMMNVLNDITAR